MKKIRNKHFILEETTEPGIKQRLKGCLLVLTSIVYKFMMLPIRVKVRDKKYNVSICGIFKNEAPYLREWIEYHRIVGIEHFYLYNNNSEDDYLAVLAPYIEEGLVTLIQWPEKQSQIKCYLDCISKYSKDTKWLGFIDIDEFVVPKATNSVYDFLKNFERSRGAVKIYWRMYGTSGMKDRDLSSLVTESFTVCWPKYYSVGKCFYNTSFEYDYDTERNGIMNHLLWTKYRGMSMPPVNAFDNVCLNHRDKVGSDDHPIQINHYFTKSYGEYKVKMAKGDAFFEVNPHDEEYFYLHEMECESVDYSAYKYLIKLKAAVGEK